MMGERLFAVYVGGRVEGCHVELHDVRFAVGERIEDCFEDLQAQWWGTPDSFHIDAFGALLWIDGYAVDLVAASQRGSERLWFLNLGGYDPAQFSELHENIFVVASDWRAAKRKAIAKIRHWDSPHKDAVYEIEKAIDIGATLTLPRRIALRPDPRPQAFKFEARYIPVGRLK